MANFISIGSGVLTLWGVKFLVSLSEREVAVNTWLELPFSLWCPFRCLNSYTDSLYIICIFCCCCCLLWKRFKSNNCLMLITWIDNQLILILGLIPGIRQ